MKTHLQFRAGVFYFRMRVPEAGVAVLGKNIRKSLGTGVWLEALSRANTAAKRLKDIFQKVKAGMLTDEKIRGMVQEVFADGLAGLERLALRGDDDVFVLSIVTDTAKRLLATNQLEDFEPVADTLLAAQQIEVGKSSTQYKKLLREIAKAYIEVSIIQAQRNEGNYLNEYDKRQSYTALTTASTISPAPRQEHAKISMKLSSLIEKYVKEMERGRRWAIKTGVEFKAYLKLFLEILGDVEIHSIDRQKLIEYKETLLKLPANRSKIKRYRNKTVAEILKMPGVDVMNVSTVNKHLTIVSTLLKWATRNDFVPKNCAEGLVIQEKRKASEERSAYSRDDLIKILRNLREINTGKHPERFWVPLIALLSGARMGEICQLHKEDFVERAGILCFSINQFEGKRVKTGSSVRMIPVHPTLVELGLMDYVSGIKQGHIWKNLPNDPKNGYAYLFEKWYSRFNRKSITADKLKTFHSFRHTFINSLKQQMVSGQLIAELVGHATGSITLERYGKDFQPDKLLDALKKLDYGFDIVQTLTK